jgi:hypothetical protein
MFNEIIVRLQKKSKQVLSVRLLSLKGHKTSQFFEKFFFFKKKTMIFRIKPKSCRGAKIQMNPQIFQKSSPENEIA